MKAVLWASFEAHWVVGKNLDLVRGLISIKHGGSVQM